MQRLFELPWVRYFGVAKTHAQMVMAALSQTLLKAANTITYQQINLNNRRTQTENANTPTEIAADRKTPLVKLWGSKNAMTQTP